MIKVIPAIIPNKEEELENKISLIRDFVSLVQIDILDGKYASTITWPYSQKNSRPGLDDRARSWNPGANFELDLMISKPEDSIEKWINLKPKAIIIHIESTNQIQELIEKIKSAGIEVGIALKPSTSNEEIYPYLEDIDFVQFMGNDKIGHHGVSLDEKIFEKIKDLRRKNKNIEISIDIGVNKETAPKLVRVGVTKLVSGSAIFNSDNIKETIEYFRSLNSN